MNYKIICRTDKTNKQGKSPLSIQFSHNGRRRRIATGLVVEPKFWDDKNQKIKPNCPNYIDLQYRLNEQVAMYEKKISKLEILEIEVTLDNLLETNGRKVNCTIGECLGATISRLESLGKYGSASKHKSLRSRLSQYRTLNIRLDEIDLAFLRDFELFLRRIGNANNSIATKFAIFKATYNKALAEEQFVTKSNPFSKFKVGSLWTNTRKRAITKEDVQKLMELNIEPSHQTEYRDFARDVFLFSYYTAGINFTDIATLRYCDIVNGRISYSRNKTQKLLSFRLMPRALEINSLSESTRIKTLNKIPYLNERYIRVEGNRLQVDRNLVNKDIVNFKICRHIYRQYTNLANELCNNGYKIDRWAYSNITERLEDKPTARVKFKDLFEEYVLLKSEEPTFSLNNNDEQCAIIAKQRPLVARAYNELGVDRVRELNYHTGNIGRELTKQMTTPTEHKIVKIVSVALPHYKVIPKATAKAELQRVYDTLGIKQRAKASDLRR